MDFSLSGEQETLRDSVRDFAQKEVAPLAAEVDRLAKFPRENIQRMAQKTRWMRIMKEKAKVPNGSARVKLNNCRTLVDLKR